MREVEYEEFTNRHGDKVQIQLSEDSFGGFHLIVKCKRVRSEDAKRVVSGRLASIPSRTFTDETIHVQLPDERTAMVEFKMMCMLHSMPGFGSDEFHEWHEAFLEWTYEACNGDTDLGFAEWFKQYKEDAEA